MLLCVTVCYSVFVCVTMHNVLCVTMCYYVFVQLSIPFDKLPDAHLRISFRHVAKAEGMILSL